MGANSIGRYREVRTRLVGGIFQLVSGMGLVAGLVALTCCRTKFANAGPLPREGLQHDWNLCLAGWK